MKQLSFIILFFFSSGLFSCQSKKVDELIIGSWTCVEVDMALIDEKVEDAGDKFALAMVKGVFESMKFSFYEDKTYENSLSSLFGEGKVNGTYEIIHDGKDLSIQASNKDEEEMFEILAISSDSLRLGNSDDIILIFAKSK